MEFRVKRLELKYFMNLQEAYLLQSRISQVMDPDPHNRQGGYFIRSLYFDNWLNTSFHEKMEGLGQRAKFRLRIYEFPPKIVKFELKQKDDDHIVKQVASIRREDLGAIQAGDYERLLSYRNRVLNQIYYRLKRHFYEPIVVVDYHRMAYYLDYNHIRITMDTRLKRSREVTEFENPDLMTLPVLQKNHVILEIKYNDFLPKWIGDLFRGVRLTRCANSKYCFSRLV